jgi:hypothetical protein
MMTMIAGLSLGASAQSSDQDLGTVMGNLSDVSTFYNLLLQYPKIMLQLPSYDGITVSIVSHQGKR